MEGWIPGEGGFAEDQEESLGAPPPDGSLMLGGQQEASVVGHDLVFGQVQVELQRHQHRELEGYQLSAVHPEPLFQFLPEQKEEEKRKELILNNRYVRSSIACCFSVDPLFLNQHLVRIGSEDLETPDWMFDDLTDDAIGKRYKPPRKW